MLYVHAYEALFGAPRGRTIEELLSGLPVILIPVLLTVGGVLRFLRRRRFLRSLARRIGERVVAINTARLAARERGAIAAE